MSTPPTDKLKAKTQLISKEVEEVEPAVTDPRMSHDDLAVRDSIKKHWHLTDEQAAIIHKWSVDDRCCTTQETVEFNMQTVAREILNTVLPAVTEMKKEKKL